jgi:transcriptional regulator with XRE-family HTH domain
VRHPLIATLLAQRLALGLTQVDVAEALKVSDATVANWESGRKNPGFEHLTAWCGFLDLDLVAVPAGLAVAA